MTTTKNKFAKASMGAASLSIALFFLVPIADLVAALIAIILGIKGLSDFKKDRSIDGKAGAISAIVIGALIIMVNLVFRLR